MRTTPLPLLALLSCIALHGGAVAAQTQDDAPQVASDAASDSSGQDAPSRVARLSYIEGKVVMAPAGTEEWTDALLNRPLTTSDRVWVDRGGKSELQVGSSTIYLDEESGFSFLDLDDDLLHMSLTDGAATIRVRRKMDNESIEIETPNATVTLLHPGEYHIAISEDGAATVVDTRSGESRVEGEKDTYTVRANEKGIFRGTEALTADIGKLGPRTAFEDWANDRERRDDDAVSAKYVSRDVVGYEDLDRNGEWLSEPEYGYVWRPRYVDAGWAPYRFGRWVWVSPWGWSWVDNSPWGFAPFHYGRWAYVRSNWCWVPGPRHIRPVYAPALVGWVGGSGVSVSVAIGSGVGWFPLGPREVYVPGYWHSPRYIRNVNVSNTIIINNTYVNNVYAGHGGHFDYRYGRSSRAVTVVTRDRFIGGRPLDGHFVHVREPDLRRWHQDGRAPAIAPDRSSVLGAQPVAHRPPVRPLIRPDQLDARRDNGQFLARRTPPQRVSFDAERSAIEANHGRPVERSQIVRGNSARNFARVPRAGSNVAAPALAGQAAGAQQRNDRPQMDRDRPDRAARIDRQDDRPNDRQNDRSNRAGTANPDSSNRFDGSNRPANLDRAESQRETSRRDSDRPQWARERSDQRDQSRDQSARENRTVPAQQQNPASLNATPRPATEAPAGSPGAAPSIKESRGSNRPWESRSDIKQERAQELSRDRTESRRSDGAAENRARQTDSQRNWRSERSSPQPQPQQNTPREPRAVEQPRSQSQPQPQPQPQPERAAQPERSTPRAAPTESRQQREQRPQNDSKADRAARERGR